MITAIGLASDPTMRHFVERAAGAGTAVQFVDLAAADHWHFQLPPAAPAVMEVEGRRYVLEPEGGFYVRAINLATVDTPESGPRWHGRLAGVLSWLAEVPGRVANRPGHHGDNASKPLHEASLREYGFAVPASLTSSDGDVLAEFAGQGPTIAKTVSGVRADCRLVTPEDFQPGRYVAAQGPVHLQRWVGGFDVRVHVVEDRLFAERIDSADVDYRVSPTSRYAPATVPDELASRIVAATAAMGLLFAGWDFRVDNEWWCFEVNPMPGYNSYDRRADGAITAALAAALGAA